MNPDFLDEFNRALRRVQEKFSDQFGTFVYLDTSEGGYSAYDAAATAADIVLAKFEAHCDIGAQ